MSTHSEAPQPSRGLSRETLDRLSREWDRSVGQPTTFIATNWTKSDGTKADALHIIRHGKQVNVITEDNMTSDLT
jgi:hypothetical protein